MFSLIQKYVLYALSALLLIALATCGYYYVRCGTLENKVTALTLDLAKVQDANAESQKTITALKTERTKTMRSYGILQQGYNASLAELIRIDDLRGGTNEIRNPKSDIRNASPDALLDALHGLYPGSGGQAGICQAGDPAHAQGAAALSGPVAYCLCSDDDVRNLLKNVALDRADSRDLRTLIEGLR